VYLSVPSWVIPGTYLENLHFLADHPVLTGVELLFFMYDAEVKRLLDTEWAGIQEYAGRFVYTAHLPDPLQPAHEELVARLLPFAHHLIVHPSSPEQVEAQGKLLNGWTEKYGGSTQGREAGHFLLENTQTSRFEALLPQLPAETGLCMDTGHLLLEGKSPADFFKRYPGRIREIHLHGLDREQAALDGRLPDHRPVRAGDRWFRDLVPVLENFTGVVNLEVFSWEEACMSIDTLGAMGLLGVNKAG
jgi:hypothetical protein